MKLPPTYILAKRREDIFRLGQPVFAEEGGLAFPDEAPGRIALAGSSAVTTGEGLSVVVVALPDTRVILADQAPLADIELDRLVISEVMKWTAQAPDHYRDNGGRLRWLVNDGSLEVDDLFQPSANIAHAWEVVEKLRGDRRDFSIVSRQNMERAQFRVSFSAPDGGIGYSDAVSAQADTAPLAICRAALLALEGK